METPANCPGHSTLQLPARISWHPEPIAPPELPRSCGRSQLAARRQHEWSEGHHGQGQRGKATDHEQPDRASGSQGLVQPTHPQRAAGEGLQGLPSFCGGSRESAAAGTGSPVPDC